MPSIRARLQPIEEKHSVVTFAVDCSLSLKVLKMTGLNTYEFNSDFYLQLHSDVAAVVNAPGSTMTARAHYDAHGINEGRISNLSWDEQAYLDAHPDVAAEVNSGLMASGLVHYEAWGISEGRQGFYDISLDSSLASNGALWGNHLNDALSGDASSNRMIGSLGDDLLVGMGGDDLLEGRADDDTLMGGTGRDTLLGGHGDDHLYGDEGWDELLGGDGDDLLNGGSGKDVLKGQYGDDTYTFRSGDSWAIISDEGNSAGDTVFFDSSINFEDVTFEKVTGKAHVDIMTGGVGDRVRVINQLAPFDSNRIEVFNFNNSTILTAEDVNAMVV